VKPGIFWCGESGFEVTMRLRSGLLVVMTM